MSNKCPDYVDEHDHDTLSDPEFLHHPAHDWVVEVPISFPWPMFSPRCKIKLIKDFE